MDRTPAGWTSIGSVEAPERLTLVAEREGLDAATAVRLDSDSNDAWRGGDVILRICWRGERGRLHREALVLQNLPAEVPHPELVSEGPTRDLQWTLTRLAPVP